MTEQDLEDFDRLAPILERAVEYTQGGWTINDVRDAVEKGEVQLWPGLRSAVVTQIVDTPRQRELHFFLAAGNMDEVRALYSIILEWGTTQGCKRATIIGRPGWQRTFLTKEEGWTVGPTIFMKELPNGQGPQVNSDSDIRA